MSILRVQKIRHTASNTDVIDIASDGTCTANLTNRTNKNLLINGSMIVAQRSQSATASSSGYPACDRWRVGVGGLDEAVTVAQSALTSSDTPYSSGFRYATKITNGNQTSGLGANDFVSFAQRLEGQDIHYSGWNFTSTSSKITVSFWIKSSVAQTFYSRFRIVEASANKEYVFAVAATTSWQKITKTISGHTGLNPKSNNDLGFFWDIILAYGSAYTGSMTLEQWNTVNTSAYVPDMASTWYTTDNATFEITGVQLEVSDHATDFEHKSYAQELLLCQRYYRVIKDGSEDNGGYIGYMSYNYDVNSVVTQINFIPEMRAAPTADSTSGTNYYRFYRNSGYVDINSMSTLNGLGRKGGAFNNADSGNGTAGQSGGIVLNNNNAKIAFSAEL